MEYFNTVVLLRVSQVKIFSYHQLTPIQQYHFKENFTLYLPESFNIYLSTKLFNDLFHHLISFALLQPLFWLVWGKPNQEITRSRVIVNI